MEELLLEMSCLEVIHNESLFPFKVKHSRRLLGAELARVRAQLSSPLLTFDHTAAATSPGVRRLTVFPEEELLVPTFGPAHSGFLPWPRIPHQSRSSRFFNYASSSSVSPTISAYFQMIFLFRCLSRWLTRFSFPSIRATISLDEFLVHEETRCADSSPWPDVRFSFAEKAQSRLNLIINKIYWQAI